jgi:hypothetical protein
VRRLVLVSLFVALTVSVTAAKTRRTVIKEQSVPATVHVSWAPNAASDNVTAYLVTLDGGTAISVSPSVCTTTCVTPITVSAFGNHAVTVVAQNQEISTDPTSVQNSAATTVNFALSPAPGAPTAAKVGK